jgi:hypothetical protein
VVRGQSPLVACCRRTIGDRRAHVIRLFVDKELIAGQVGEDVRRQVVLGRQLDPEIAASAAERQRAKRSALPEAPKGATCKRPEQAPPTLATNLPVHLLHALRVVSRQSWRKFAAFGEVRR